MDKNNMLREIFLGHNPEAKNDYLFLEKKYEVDYSFYYDVELFVRVFREHFVNEFSPYLIGDGKYGMSRSNVTYHTAIGISNTARLLGWACKFETEGKRDAIIETRTDKPVPLIACEWEYDGDNIFGKGKELDKLWKSSSKCNSALLITYCEKGNFQEYSSKVIDYWMKKCKGRKKGYLAFVTIIYQKPHRTFELIRTIYVNESGICIEEDKFF